MLVRTPETAFWVYRYTRAGRMREMGLGRARGTNAVTLAEAREAAGKLFRAVRAGRDPLDDKLADAARTVAEAQDAAIRRVTFQEVAESYISANSAAWRNPKHRKQWGTTLETYVYPVIGSLPVADVATVHLLAILEPIWRAKPETAARVRGRIEAVLTAATVKGLRTGSNPAAWRGHLAEILPARADVAPVEHHAALPWREIGTFMAALRHQSGMGARALEFAILTAARTGEVLRATWAEIDMAAGLWTIPAARMKARREHRVPLSPQALAVLREAAGARTTDSPDEPVFPGGRPGKGLSDMALTMVLRRMKRTDLTVHGFRSVFRDWAAEQTTFPAEVAEMALAHAVGDRVEAAYRRGDLMDKRKRLMADWASFCARMPATGAVVPIRA